MDSEPALLDHRDKRIANAIRLRRATICEEMEACERLADALFDEFTELAEAYATLGRALALVELRLQGSGAYYLSPQQASVVLDRIEEIGGDTRRFCEYVGVEGIAKIPAHRFEDALAALEAKRRRMA